MLQLLGLSWRGVAGDGDTCSPGTDNPPAPPCPDCRYDYEKFGTPYKKGSRYYYSHNSGLQNQYVVSEGGPTPPPFPGGTTAQRGPPCLPAPAGVPLQPPGGPPPSGPGQPAQLIPGAACSQACIQAWTLPLQSVASRHPLAGHSCRTACADLQPGQPGWRGAGAHRPQHPLRGRHRGAGRPGIQRGRLAVSGATCPGLGLPGLQPRVPFHCCSKKTRSCQLLALLVQGRTLPCSAPAPAASWCSRCCCTSPALPYSTQPCPV